MTVDRVSDPLPAATSPSPSVLERSEREVAVQWMRNLMQDTMPVQAGLSHYVLACLGEEPFLPDEHSFRPDCIRWLRNMIRDEAEWPPIAKSSRYLLGVLGEWVECGVWHNHYNYCQRPHGHEDGDHYDGDRIRWPRSPSDTMVRPPAPSTPDVEYIAVAVGSDLRSVENRLIRATLRKVGGDKGLCAQLLGIATRTLYRRLKELPEDCPACGSSDHLPHESTLDCRGAARRERDAVAARVSDAALEKPSEDRGVSKPLRDGPPPWTRDVHLAKRVWSEDDADVGCPGHETLDAAFRRLYPGKQRAPVSTWDGGDAVYELLSGGIVVVASYPGNSEICEAHWEQDFNDKE